MNKYENVKFFYFYDLSIYFIIFYITALRILHITSPDIGLLFCIVFGQILLLNFLKYKEKSNKASVIVTLIITIPVLFLFFSFSKALSLIPIIFFISIYTIRNFDDLVLYEHYSRKIKEKLIKLFILGIFTSLIYVSSISSKDVFVIADLFRGYIIFLMISVILLREGRNYSFSLQGNKSLITDIIILIVSFIMSIKALFNIFLSALLFIIKLMGAGILYLTEKLAVYIIVPVIKYLISPLFYKFAKNANKNKTNIDPNLYKANGESDIKNEIVSKINFPKYVNYILGIIAILIVCYIIYKVLKRHNISKPISEEVVEEREALVIENKKDKTFIKKLRSYILSDSKEKVYFQYRRILIASEKAGIFKKFMTPTALKNILKTFGNDSDKLEDATKTYNEAKFSNHEITLAGSKKMKEDVDKLLPLVKK